MRPNKINVFIEIIFVVLVSAISTNAFAITDMELAAACFDTGKAKLLKQAESFGCPIDIRRIEVESVDNRWYSPSKYVWYQVMGECHGYDRLIELVQHYNGKCF